MRANFSAVRSINIVGEITMMPNGAKYKSCFRSKRCIAYYPTQARQTHPGAEATPPTQPP